MTETVSDDELEALYTDTMEKALKILRAPANETTQAQRDQAETMVQEATTKRLDAIMGRIRDRTAALEELTVRIQALTEAIKVKPPYLSALEDFNTVMDKAVELLKKARGEDTPQNGEAETESA